MLSLKNLARIITLKRSKWDICGSSKFLTSCLKSESVLEIGILSKDCRLVSLRYEGN